jgi:hypothetical protein
MTNSVRLIKPLGVKHPSEVTQDFAVISPSSGTHHSAHTPQLFIRVAVG